MRFGRFQSDADRKQTRPMLGILAISLLLASALRCGDAPTQPNLRSGIPTAVPRTLTPTRTPIPRTPVPPTPIPLNLSGNWNGTFENPSRCNTPERIDVRLVQTVPGIYYDFVVEMNCLGPYDRAEFRGKLNGSSLTVDLQKADQTVCGLSGSASSTTIEASSRSSTQCAGARLHLSR